MVFKQGERGRNKRQVDLGLRDYYAYYKDRSIIKGRKPVELTLFSTILKEFNTLLREQIVYNNECIKLPYRLGYLGVIKYEVNFDPEKQNFWRVDYKKSKEVDYLVYYDEPFRYKWKWNKTKAKVRGRKSYIFVPCRSASRLIAKAKRENPRLDYFEKIGK